MGYPWSKYDKLTAADLNAEFAAVLGSVAPVTAVAGRTGSVTLSHTDILDWAATLSPYALLASPTLTGTPRAPTATLGSTTTQIATTAFVANAVVAATTGVATFNTRSGAVTLVAADLTTPLTTPSAIGSVTPSTGAFTTISATQQISSTLAIGTAPFSVTSTTQVNNLNVSQLVGATWVAPGTIGSTTPNTGKFTTVQSTQATGTAPFIVASTTQVSNLNVSSLVGATWIAPGTIGSTTPSTGKFTTLTATGLISPASAVGIAGTATNDSAPAGSIGEYTTAALLIGSAVALTTVTAANVTSISLTAGDWDVTGNVGFSLNVLTVPTLFQGCISTTSATMQAQGEPGVAGYYPPQIAGQVTQSMALNARRISLAGTTTVYLVALCSFGTNTAAAFGTIRARRVR